MPYRSPGSKIANTFQYTQEESDFLTSIKPWENKWTLNLGSPANNNQRKAIKTKIKTDLIGIQGNYCAFCGLNLKLTHQVHREHIAPQYKHPEYIFEPENLVLSCDYCNLEKGKKLTVSTNTGEYATENFKILHPYRDDFDKHLACDFTKKELVFKIINADPAKAEFTIKCVGLDLPHLMTLRAAIIILHSLPSNNFFDSLYSQIINWKRKARKTY
ncbi:HNH endonuclease [Flavobacterium sp. FlaQc-51]|uniref:HNH endonuclease n=1 Tax=Flavobacterium sp. FlaQc-51 TaxID=3374184 RepID=UPI003756F556